MVEVEISKKSGTRVWVEVGARKQERVLWNTQGWLGTVDSGGERVQTQCRALKQLKKG